MKEKSFYGDSIILLNGAITNVESKLEIIRQIRKQEKERDPITYITSRVKSEDSMKEKLKRKGYDVTLENALTKIHDAAGLRIICPYINDCYEVSNLLKKYKDMKLITEKDYIKNPKENGYRSLHDIFLLSLDVAGDIKEIYVEVQIRTIAMDFWSSLEHEMKYKRNIENQDIIVKELRDCADRIATTDLNMQTIKNMIEENSSK